MRSFGPRTKTSPSSRHCLKNDTQRCRACNGKGKIFYQIPKRVAPLGRKGQTYQRSCPICGGSGKEIDAVWRKLSGEALEDRTTRLYGGTAAYMTFSADGEPQFHDPRS